MPSSSVKTAASIHSFASFSLPSLLSPHLFSYSSHIPLAPISECGTMSYGMALRCAKTAEVMDTDGTHTASCDACKWAGYSWLGSWEPGAERCTISSAPPSRTAPGQVDPTNEPSSMWDSSQHLEKDRDPSDNTLSGLPQPSPLFLSRWRALNTLQGNTGCMCGLSIVSTGAEVRF